MRTKLLAMPMQIRSYRRDDEVKIVRLLNICFGNWGSIQKWNSQYLRYPNFHEKDVFIIEKDGEIIGHEALRFRDLMIGKESAISTTSLIDAAVNPDYRGQGLHNKLIDIMLQNAKSRGACLVLSWYLRDSGLHKHSERMGFDEIKQPPAYMKIVRPEKLFRSGMLDFLHKSPGLEEVINKLGVDLYFSFGTLTFALAQLLRKPDHSGRQSENKIEVVFNESSLLSLIRFRNMTGRQRLINIILLLALRRVQIKFGSIGAFLELVRNGPSLIGSI